MKKYLKWLFVPVFGIVNFLFLAFAVIVNGGGHGPTMPFIIMMSPLLALEWLTKLLFPANWVLPLFLIYLVFAFSWMGEAVLALCRNKYCKWAFLIVVLGRYIYTLILLFSGFVKDNSQVPLKEEMGALLFVAIPYIGVQLLLWILFLKTWDLWKPPWKKR